MLASGQGYTGMVQELIRAGATVNVLEKVLAHYMILMMCLYCGEIWCPVNKQ